MSYQWDVFLSYSHKDINAVSVIMNDLQSAGFRVWQDQTTIIPGRRIREAIHEGIQNSACILILLSRYSLKSKWVLNELDAAMLREIREGKNLVVPILLGRVDEVSIPADIQGKNFIDLRHNFLKNYQRRRDLIVDVVRLAVRTTRSPMAEEWFMGNEGVAMLLTCDYTDRPVSRADRLIEIMIDDLFRDGESYWRRGCKRCT